MSGEEVSQALKRLDRISTSTQVVNKTKKKSQTTASPPVKAMTAEEQIKILDRLSQQH
jgi:ribosomal protein S21